VSVAGGEEQARPLSTLLGIDLGLRTGLALYGSDGRLLWYRSQNFGTATRLRRAVHGQLGSLPQLEWVILEGGGNLARIWEKEAERRGLRMRRIAAEQWREKLLLSREQRRGSQAKDADRMAPHHRVVRRAPRHGAASRHRGGDHDRVLGSPRGGLAPDDPAGAPPIARPGLEMGAIRTPGDAASSGHRRT
jgi:hypothetical protein